MFGIFKRIGRKSTSEQMRDAYFLPNSMFCPECLTYEYWFTGGGSWSPERCPYHMKSDEVILWKQMTRKQKREAVSKHDGMWFNKFGNHYFKEFKDKNNKLGEVR